MQMWKQNRTLFEYFRFMGYLMMIVGVYLLVGGIGDYAEQSRQNDWISTEATVTDVSSEVVSSSPPHSICVGRGRENLYGQHRAHVLAPHGRHCHNREI